MQKITFIAHSYFIYLLFIYLFISSGPLSLAQPSITKAINLLNSEVYFIRKIT